MSWSSRRRTMYFSGFAVFVIALIGIPAFLFFYDPPTCADGKQNGEEEGVDCGGSCAIICSFSAAEPIVHWSRLFQIIPGAYSVVAFVENPNSTVGAYDVPYSFKLRGTDNVLVYERKGTLYVPPQGRIPVFETGIQTGERIPVRVEFVLGAPVWERLTPAFHDLSIIERELSNPTTLPRLTATLRNNGVDDVEDFSVVAVLFDAEENAIQASRTVVASLPGLSETALVFTWPEPLASSVATIEITPLFLPPTR